MEFIYLHVKELEAKQKTQAHILLAQKMVSTKHDNKLNSIFICTKRKKKILVNYA